MISRIMLSLKKAADSSLSGWSIMQETANDNTFPSKLMFNTPPRSTVKGEGIAIPLDTFREP